MAGIYSYFTNPTWVFLEDRILGKNWLGCHGPQLSVPHAFGVMSLGLKFFTSSGHRGY